MLPLFAAVVGALLLGAQSSVRGSNFDAEPYQDVLMQDLYKRLSQIDSSYFLDDPSYAEPSAGDWSDTGVRMEPRPSGQADIRDSEYLEHSSNAGSTGFIHMSGGAGEGKQHLTPDGSQGNPHQVKSDEALPFYCHPPNPCPKGLTSKDGCQESVEDSADVQKAWITKMQEKGMCSCDEEHMFDCPKVKDTAFDAKTAENQQELDEVIDKILGEKHENPYVGGQKRTSLVAKKSPRVKRSSSDDAMEMELERARVAKRGQNPYLGGERLRTVAKKGSPGVDRHF